MRLLAGPLRVALLLLLTCLGSLAAHAEWFDLHLVQVGGDHAGAGLNAHVTGKRSGDDYSFILDTYNPGIATDGLDFNAWFLATDGISADASDEATASAQDADKTFGFLHTAFTVEEDAIGAIVLVVTITYADGTYTELWFEP